MKRGKLYRILAVAILLSLLLLVIIPGTPVRAAPTLTVLPASGAVGTKVAVTGENFDSYIDDDVHVFFGNQQVTISPITVSETGSFSYNFNIPDGTEPGRYEIRVEGELGTLALALFTVLKAEISLDSKAGGVGTAVTISGQGFYANRMVSFYYDDRLLGSEEAGGTGEFSYSFTIPEGIAGKHKFAAKNAEGHSGEAEFEVLPTIALNATSATAGGILAVSGGGFGPRSSIDIYFGHDEIAYAKTNEFGSFKVTLFNVPEMALGIYDVTAIDKHGNKAKAMFTIIAEAITEAKLDKTTPLNWVTYTLIGVGALVIGILAFWLGRKTAYH